MRRNERLGEIIKNYDWLLTVVVFVLAAIGLSAVYSVDLSRGGSLIFFPRQVISIAVGFIALFVVGGFHMTFYQASARVIYTIALVLLVGVLFFGETIRGTTGWFRVVGLSFQPAEFAKVALVLLLGWLMGQQGRRFDRWEFVVSSGLATAFLAGLILLQPDIGSAAVLFGIWFGLLLFARVKKRYIVLLVGGVVCGIALGWFFFFQEYQRDRIRTFLDPARDPLGSGYNVTQSVIAIGSGGLFGRGLGFGSQSQLHFLPETQTDFIFSVIGEELGFIGICLVLALYFLLLWRLLYIARSARDDFSSYTVSGILLLFFIQVVVNIGGAMGLLPLTGMTLPFLSYGGSSFIMNAVLVGVAESIFRSARRRVS